VRAPLATAIILCAGTAHAYQQPVHVRLSTREYVGALRLVGAGDGGDAARVRALRERIWRAGATAGGGLQQRFLARYPELARFDAWELKRLLALNPDQRVAGLDEDVPLPVGSDGAAVFAAASRLPDDDRRNQDRFRHDASRAVVRDHDGKPLPDDPATLEMGDLTGLSSQAHAHYGLPKIAFSDDPEVLKHDPRRFAIPPTVHTFGAAFADLYTALAVISAKLDGGERLALVHAGAAAHHIQDVANQIHTVQVGIYDFFVDAKVESLKEELRSVGGLLRPRPTFVSIGIDIIANHHTLAEALYAKHLLAPGDPVARLLAPVDTDFETALGRIPAACSPGFGRSIAEAMIDRSSFEGAPVYAAIRAVANRDLSRVGHHFHDDSDDPDAFVRPGADLSHFYDLEARGAARADQALAAWWSRFSACHAADADAFVLQLVSDRLDALDAQEARARAWTPRAASQPGITLWVPLLYLALIALAVWIARIIRRRRA
jgi:hypothetical protein